MPSMNMKITKDKWIWMPHAGHFIAGNSCQFHLATKVGKYLVSTVGDLWFERGVREIHARVHDAEWYLKNKHLLGDEFDNAYMKRFGYEEVGIDRKYETMVFPVVGTNSKNRDCCPWTAKDWSGIDFAGYNDADKAYKGHLKMCEKFSTK